MEMLMRDNLLNILTVPGIFGVPGEESGRVWPPEEHTIPRWTGYTMRQMSLQFFSICPQSQFLNLSEL